MKVDTNKILASSLFSGFQNTPSVTGSNSIHAFFSIPPGTSGTLTPGHYIGPIPIVIPLNNANAVSQVQIQYGGVDAFWRLLPGSIVYNVPAGSPPNYQIESFSYFSGGNLHVDTVISNNSGVTATIPDITISVRAFIFNAPF